MANFDSEAPAYRVWLCIIWASIPNAISPATGGHVGAMSVPDWNVAERRAERWAGLKHDLETIAAHASMAGLDYLLIENLVSVREPSTMARIDPASSGELMKTKLKPPWSSLRPLP